jgi:hypothetical protein
LNLPKSHPPKSPQAGHIKNLEYNLNKLNNEIKYEESSESETERDDPDMPALVIHKNELRNTRNKREKHDDMPGLVMHGNENSKDNSHSMSLPQNFGNLSKKDFLKMMMESYSSD